MVGCPSGGPSWPRWPVKGPLRGAPRGLQQVGVLGGALGCPWPGTLADGPWLGPKMAHKEGHAKGWLGCRLGGLKALERRQRGQWRGWAPASQPKVAKDSRAAVRPRCRPKWLRSGFEGKAMVGCVWVLLGVWGGSQAGPEGRTADLMAMGRQVRGGSWRCGDRAT